MNNMAVGATSEYMGFQMKPQIETYRKKHQNFQRLGYQYVTYE